MTHVTCRLTAKNWDQPRNPTLCNRVRATFTFYLWVETIRILRAEAAGRWATLMYISYVTNEGINFDA